MNHIYMHHYGCCLCFTVQFDLFPFQKFICSTVRPTYLPYKELYGFDGCASFVADYLNYESLTVPNELVCAPSRPAQDIDGFHGTFTMGTGGHYITMLLAGWSISTSYDPLPSSCCSEKMLWNPSIERTLYSIIIIMQ